MFTDCKTTKSRSVPCEPLYLNSDITDSTPCFGLGPPYYGGKTWVPYRRWSRQLSGIQITESDRNRWPPPKEEVITDLGSEFYSRKTEILNGKFPTTVLDLYPYPASSPCVPGTHPYKWHFVTNTMIANGFGDGVSANCNMNSINALVVPSFTDLSSTRQQLVIKGTAAVSACSPSNQIANASTAIGELLQDVPNIPGLHLLESRLRALEVAAKSSDEFLNIVFGVRPTISDLQLFVKGVQKVEKRVDQFIKDSGHNVRRKFAFPKERTTTTEVLPNILSPVGSYQSGSTYGSWLWGTQDQCRIPVYETIRERTVERETWFSGAFTYHLPDWFDTTSVNDRRRLMAELLGAKPDLNTLWNLTPWSWAVDWFTNAGTYVKNLTSLINYGTVMRYGYIMETTTVTDTYTAGALRFAETQANGGLKPPYPAVSPITLRTTVKKRIRANPFGFGLNWDGLSPTQLAIAAALGITRVVR